MGIFCLNLDLDVPALEEESTSDLALNVSDPAPLPTCTKDTDHMKNFKVLVDKDVNTADITGTLDEDISKLNLHVGLKLHVSIFPVPITVDVPISFTPGVKKGDLKWHFSADKVPPPPKSKVKIDG